MINISIICPTYNEEKYISSCIESVLVQDYPKDKIEVLFIDGGSIDDTLNIIESYQLKYSFIKLLNNPNRIVPYAMNIGIKESVGDIIIRIDAHSSYPKDYFSALVRNMSTLNADNIGTVCITEVKNSTTVSNAIKKVLSNKFGVGNSLFRTGISEITETDTVPFGCYKKEVFSKYGLYDERLTRNQDIELNKRIINGGGKIFLIPDTTCTYYAREDYKSLANNNYSNGLWNILTAYYTSTFNSLSLRHFIPLIFILSIVVPLIFSIFFLPFIYLSLLSIVFYLFFVSLIAFKLNDEKTSWSNIVKAFLVLHISYGVGSLIGIFKVVKLYFTK